MKKEKLIQILRNSTANAFSRDWYEVVSSKISKELDLKCEVVYDSDIRLFSTKILHNHFDSLIIGKYYTNKDFIPLVKDMIPDITPKRIRMELRIYAKANNLYLKIKNATPNGRQFALLNNK